MEVQHHFVALAPHAGKEFHVADKIVEVDPPGLQKLAAGEGEKMAGERGGIGRLEAERT